MSRAAEPMAKDNRDRCRMIVDTTERNRYAIRQHSLDTGKTISEIINEWVVQHLSEELKRYDKKLKGKEE